MSALIYGDHSGAAMHLRLIASDGRAAIAAAAIRGSDGDSEPLWPQWISPAIPLDFKGWKKISFPVSSFSYRAPAGETAADAPKMSKVDAFGIDFTDGGETAMLDNLTWLSSASTVSPLVVDDFETGNFAAWQTHGTPETVQDAQLALVTEPAKVQAGRVAFSVSFAAAKQVRQQALALMKSTLQATGQSYLTYVPASPFRRILPASVPQPGETAQAIQLFAAPNQTESGSFCIYADSALSNLTVAPVSGLEVLGHSIDVSNIDVRVVKVWTREGTGKYRDPDSNGPIPELLMKDDREPLQVVNGQAPEVRLTGNAATTVPAHTTKQFWVTVHVPNNTAPGHYSTQLAVSAPGARTSSVTLMVEVLPLPLYSASKQYIMGLGSRLASAGDSAGAPVESMDQATFAAQLADIHDHGFLYATLMDPPTNLWDSFKAYKSASLGTPLIYSGLTGSSDQDIAASDQIDGQRRANGVDSVAYLAPEGASIDELTALHKARRTTAAFIRSPDQFNSAQAALDMPIYSVDEPYVQELLRTAGKRTSDKYDYWFWPAYENDPQANRLYAGYLLYRANLYGAFVPNYQSPYAADPFGDQSDSSATGDAAKLRPAMLTYPVKGGVLDTIQWEAVLAGVNDIRYLTTYFAALRECKDNHVARDVVVTTEPSVKAMMGKAFWIMDDTEYQKARRVIGHNAVLLRKGLDAFYKHGGADPVNANATPVVKPTKLKVTARPILSSSHGS